MKHIVGFSGGVDSQACALWVRQHFPAEDVLLMNSDPGGNEHPLTTAFIRHYSETVFPVTVVTPLVRDLGNVGSIASATQDRRASLNEDDPLTFDLLAWVKGIFPSRKAQFCTEFLKLRPQLRWLKENLPDEAYTRYAGVRADESQDRANLPEKQWDTFFDCELVRPLITWKKGECFRFLADHGEEVNPLYRLGFNRVGCAPCINANKGDVREWAARFPGMIDKVRTWEKSVGKTFFAPIVPELRINWVDEVVAWSRTERGGKQLSLPFVEIDAEKKSCTSKYGLCE